jgi:hypothetical protein
VEVSFASAELATLCNSRTRLQRRWGPDGGRLVARRLAELAAADADALGQLPRAQVSEGSAGETIIIFGGGEVVFRAVVLDDPAPAHPQTNRQTRLLITGLDARGKARS